ncbi:MAG: hypothetical protein ABI333_02025 [bacterium]
MLQIPTSRTVLCGLAATLLLTSACKDDSVIGDYTCGDGVCNGEEDSSNCDADCLETCGDGYCQTVESSATCPADCPVNCGDGQCQSDETAVGCPGDCAGPLYPGPCTSSATTVSPGAPSPDETFTYEMVDGLLEVWLIPDGGTTTLLRFDPEQRIVARAIDYEQDGVLDHEEQFFYDGEGRLMGAETRDGDEGALLTETTYSYDATGYLAQSYRESFTADAYDIETTYTWDASHTVCHEYVDEHADGTIDWTDVITYDFAGNVARIERNSFDPFQCDFVYDQAHLREVGPGAMHAFPWRDLNLRRVRLLEILCVRGNEVLDDYQFFYDAHGNLTGWWYRRDPYDYTTHFVSYQYDCWP